MAHYFFNVVEDGHKVDTIGADYADPQIARMEAVCFAAQLLKKSRSGFGRAPS
jgi:hypothetical protein